MTSNDNFITVEIFNARMDKLEAIVEKNLALTQKENAELKMQVQKDMNTFKNEIRTDINNFKKEVREDLSKLDTKIDKVHGEVIVLQQDVEGLKHDVTGLYHWDYWLLSIILIVFVMPQFIVGIQSFFKAITEGINGIRSAFKGKN